MQDGHGVRVAVEGNSITIRTMRGARDGQVELTLDDAEVLYNLLSDAMEQAGSDDDLEPHPDDVTIEDHTLRAWKLNTHGADADRVIRRLIEYVEYLESENLELDERLDEMVDDQEEDAHELRALRQFAESRFFGWIKVPANLVSWPTTYEWMTLGLPGVCGGQIDSGQFWSSWSGRIFGSMPIQACYEWRG